MGGNNDDDNDNDKNHRIIGLRNLAKASAAQKFCDLKMAEKYMKDSRGPNRAPRGLFRPKRALEAQETQRGSKRPQK